MINIRFHTSWIKSAHYLVAFETGEWLSKDELTVIKGGEG